MNLTELQVVTSGDRIQDRPLSEVGGKGLFVKEIEEALLDGRADIAVHSMKDVPGVLPEGLAIVCIPKREDPRDVIVSPRYGTLDALPEGAKVGTSSLRRAVALRIARPDLNIVPLRGNVDTRLRKVDAGECDAILLARAGLVRLGLEHRATDILDPARCLPAVGQGALGIEAREADAATAGLLAPLHDRDTALCVSAERGVMVALEGDCRTPIGAYAVVVGDGADRKLHLRAFVSAPDGRDYRASDDIVPLPASESEARRMGLDVGLRLASQVSLVSQMKQG